MNPRPVLALVESNTTGTGRLFALSARLQGLRPVLLSTRPDRYPWVALDGVDVAWADTNDPEAVALVCARLGRAGGVAGITSSSEYFVATAARAAARLGLPGPVAGAVEQCRDKRRQRVALCRAGVPVPAFEAVSSVAAAVGAASEIGLPVVCKPADGTGSRGVRLCRDLAEVADHARRLLARGRDERGRPSLPWILVEEYIAGPEISAETFGERIIGVAAKHLGPLPDFVETGHDFPANVPAGAADVARRAISALDLGWGPAHTEIRLGAAGPVVVEVNPRLAGGQIPVLVRLASGIDLIAATVAVAAGDDADVPSPAPGHASIRFILAPRRGRLRRVSGLADAAAVPRIFDVEVTARPGADVGGTGSFLDRIGHVIAAGPSAEEVRRAAEQALSACSVELAAHDEAHEAGGDERSGTTTRLAAPVAG